MCERYISDEQIQAIASELSRDYGFEHGPLHSILRRATESYIAERDALLVHDNGASQIAEVRRILELVLRAERGWSNLSSDARQQIAFFMSPSAVGEDHFGSQLARMVQVLDEYTEHYERERGNPRRSRHGDRHFLDPLRRFSEPLINFWLTEKGSAFGHVVDRYEEADGFDPGRGQKAPRVPFSDALEFLEGAAQCVPEKFQHANFETVVRSIKRDRKRRG